MLSLVHRLGWSQCWNQGYRQPQDVDREDEDEDEEDGEDDEEAVTVKENDDAGKKDLVVGKNEKDKENCVSKVDKIIQKLSLSEMLASGYQDLSDRSPGQDYSGGRNQDFGGFNDFEN